eukprot:GHVS01076964.1.p2 GENE.GHVS01076964.1~~GHVS01076964.1.p2  ORF type:complete len:118 (+),score=34.07 GHVS01076964.1:357-710(+)
MPVMFFFPFPFFLLLPDFSSLPLFVVLPLLPPLPPPLRLGRANGGVLHEERDFTGRSRVFAALALFASVLSPQLFPVLPIATQKGGGGRRGGGNGVVVSGVVVLSSMSTTKHRGNSQ